MNLKEQNHPPMSPSEGEAQSVVTYWNSFSQLPAAKILTQGRARNLRKRLADPFWREHWRQGIQRVESSAFLTGSGPKGWRATLDWFIRADSLAKILEGAYGNQSSSVRKESPSSTVYQVKARLDALEKLREEHPGHPNANYLGRPTREEREEFRKIEGDIHKLRRELAGL